MDFEKLFVKSSSLKEAAQLVLKTIATIPHLVNELNNLENVLIDEGDSLSHIGVVDALQKAISSTEPAAKKIHVMQIASQSLINAISKYDDIHDTYDIHYDPSDYRLNANNAVNVDIILKTLNKAATKRLGIGGKVVEMGCVEYLQYAVNL